MHIRLLRRRDFPFVRALALRVWKKAYSRIYAQSTIFRCVENYYSDLELERDFKRAIWRKGFFLVVVDEGIVGYAAVGIKGQGWELQRLYVDPRYQGVGIGNRLLRVVEMRLRKLGARQYATHPHGKNLTAKQFYLHKGFVHVSQRDRGNVSPCFVKKL